ncbi:DNA polymerase III subunit psi [Caviibacterium pharyngocola]|uniref:DNA polymerase III subunit psi n=1 Tax=Caviibacterium pharyngocola TaxID=28159 RepID=A0A2M8RZ45_9PAST|nr:DNA polymerase III subunit psi [Caviibacterium pharyngocola]PJG84161.1 DNA polymerase III subunit psi [Caviibacterium pharyngocola]
MNRRDLLLQEMGITQWRLNRPDVLKGAVNTPVDNRIRLIIVSEKPAQADKLLDDILFGLEMTRQDYLQIDFDFVPLLNIQHPVFYWLLSDNEEKIHRTLTLCKQAIAQWHSPDWQTFAQTPQAKRALWQQIQHC